MPGGATYGASGDFNKFDEAQIRWVSVDELHAWIADKHRPLALFDVRDAADYAAGSIPGARHLPQGDMFMGLEAYTPKILEELAAAKDADLVLFANTGGGGGAAAGRDLYVLNVFAEIGGVGVERMVRLTGGLSAWKAAGYELSTPPKPTAAANLDAMLAEADLSHLADALAGQSLDGLTEALKSGRTHLLEKLKELGLKLPDRQKCANAVGRVVKLQQGT